MLLNGILFNTEIWYKLTDTDIKRISNVDEYIMRKILGAPAKTPIEALYLETGCLPIKYIIQRRRLMYLHHILRRPDNELIKKFYNIQKLKVSKGDWAETIITDKTLINLQMSDNEIAQLSKYKFKNIFKKKIEKKHMMI